MTQAFKLMRKRKDGSLGSLFINRKQRIPVGEWLDAEEHETKGFAFRPGWHVLPKPEAPHLKESEERVWAIVEVEGITEHQRPESQGGTWWLAERMRVVEVQT